MSKPTATSPLSSPSHSALHNFHVDVKMYGAVGDNATDDTAAIQAAIDACPVGGTVYLPAPVTTGYLITSSLTIDASTKQGITFKGAGKYTLIRQGTAGASIFTTTGSTYTRDLKFENIEFYGGTKQFNSATNGGIRTRFRDCIFTSAVDGSVYMGGTNQLGYSFVNCLFLENAGHVINVVDSTYSNNVEFDQCWFQGSVHTSYVNMPFTTGNFGGHWEFNRCLFEGPWTASQTASLILGGNNYIEFNNCHWADYENTSTDKPLIKTHGVANGIPNNVTFDACGMYNRDGPIVEFVTNSTGGVAWVFTGCELNPKLAGGGPFLLNATPLTVTLVGCNILVAQASWGVVSATLVNCREAGIIIPLRIFTTTAAGKVLELAKEGQLALPITGSTGGLLVGGDANLYRSAANILKTDDKLVTATGLGVGNSASASSLGTVTDKIEVFDASGASLGYLPVYDAIS